MKKLLALLLAVFLMAACAVSASAAVTTDGGTGETVVQLDAAAATFSVTVSTSIAITVNVDGTVTCPDASAVEIVNNSTAAVKVTDVSMKNGTWFLVSYAGTDWPTQKVDSKKLGFQMTCNGNTVATTTDGNQALTTGFDATKWVMAQKGAKLNVTCAAKASALSSAIAEADKVNAASIVFTVAWAD